MASTTPLDTLASVCRSLLPSVRNIGSHPIASKKTESKTSRYKNRVWTDQTEKTMSYLWYLNCLTSQSMTFCTGLSLRQCQTKKEEFPLDLPVDMEHAENIDRLARELLGNGKSIFHVENKVTTTFGAKSMEEVYNFWKANFDICDWADEEINELSMLIQNQLKESESISWKRIEKDISFYVSRKRCKLAYEAYIKGKL